MRGCILVGAFTILWGHTTLAQTAVKSFTHDQLIADLEHLERTLRRVHPGLFMYATPEDLAARFDRIRGDIGAGMTGLRFLAHISELYALLGDGHTMFLPSDEDATGRYLPLDAVWLNGRLYILRNGSSDKRLAPGTEIHAINGIPAVAVMDTLLMRQIRDGWNVTYPQWIINRWFKAYYRFSYGEPERFDLLISTALGEEHVTIEPLTGDSIRANHALNGTKAVSEPTFNLSFVHGDGPAILTVPSLEKGSITSERLDNAFAEIRQRGATGLILDLRGDQGGEPRHAKRLLAHLLHERFELVHEGPASGSMKPRRDAFTGKLVVLVDGGSFSATGMVLSCLERHERATFIGEEAGGNRTVLAGSPRHFVLPNSRINCYISTRLWQLSDRPNDGHGVMPTIAVSPTIEDIIAGRDPMIESAMKHLRSMD